MRWKHNSINYKQLFMKRNFIINASDNMVSICPKTKRAELWMANHLIFESWQLFGKTLFIDRRLADDIIEAIESDF